MGCFTMTEGAGKGWKWVGKEISTLVEGWKERGNPTGSHLSSPSGRSRMYPKGTFNITPCRTFEAKVASCITLDELNGFANRRRVLNIDLPKWTEYERQVILARKYELEKNNGK